MNRELAEKVANTILYEGYILYPYRPSAIKNRQRWTFGNLHPPAYEEVIQGTESARMHSECLLVGNGSASLHVQLRFLHLLSCQLTDSDGNAVPSLVVDGRPLESRNEGVARSIEFHITDLNGSPSNFHFDFPDSHDLEPLRESSGAHLGTLTRVQHPIAGTIAYAAERVRDNVVKVSIDVVNGSGLAFDAADRDQALLRSLGSAHTILSAGNAEFISLLEPEEEFRELVGSCRQVGNFPVLIGDAPERDMILCSPILLYDYPQIAPESAGDFFDGTEMDEMLTLRVMTLTDEEKDVMRFGDEHVRELLQRTEESAPEQLMKTHGTIRNLRPSGEEHD